MTTLRKGTRVTWAWGAHTAEGRIAERFTGDVERTIEGATVKRKATRRELQRGMAVDVVRARDGSARVVLARTGA